MLHDIVAVPMDFYSNAKNKTDEFMLFSGGWPTTSITPVFSDLTKFANCLDFSLDNPFNEQYITLSDSFKPEHETNYYFHLDGSEGGDSYGICMCHAIGKNERGIIIKIDLLGAPSKQLCGTDFNLDRIDDLFQIIINRGFKIKVLTYDRATDIRPIKNMLEPSGSIVEHMSIDRTANFPLVDYSKLEPPFMRKETTNGEYWQPFLDFNSLIEHENLIVPNYDMWMEIPYCIEKNATKKIVTKLPGRQDNLAQAVAGALFNCINNEKEQDHDEVVKKGNQNLKLEIKEKPDSFEAMLDSLQVSSYERNKVDDKEFDKSDIPDELGVEDDLFNDNIHSKYYL